jgi:hypothetical protein
MDSPRAEKHDSTKWQWASGKSRLGNAIGTYYVQSSDTLSIARFVAFNEAADEDRKSIAGVQ